MVSIGTAIALAITNHKEDEQWSKSRLMMISWLGVNLVVNNTTSFCLIYHLVSHSCLFRHLRDSTQTYSGESERQACLQRTIWSITSFLVGSRVPSSSLFYKLTTIMWNNSRFCDWDSDICKHYCKLCDVFGEYPLFSVPSCSLK